MSCLVVFLFCIGGGGGKGGVVSCFPYYIGGFILHFNWPCVRTPAWNRSLLETMLTPFSVSQWVCIATYEAAHADRVLT